MTKLVSPIAICAMIFSTLFYLQAESKKPNIVFIYADDLDADEINCTMKDVDIWPSPSGVKRVHGVGHKARGLPGRPML